MNFQIATRVENNDDHTRRRNSKSVSVPSDPIFLFFLFVVWLLDRVSFPPCFPPTAKVDARENERLRDPNTF
jgi:hypothetical protein